MLKIPGTPLTYKAIFSTIITPSDKPAAFSILKTSDNPVCRTIPE